ncbi:MAG: serine hydrolase [Verrucomicrobia bacterium]|nr:serine hydrolase [Verrucomicrobiota bacterium]
MKSPLLFRRLARWVCATLASVAWFTTGFAQAPDKAKLDQFFDRLAEKNKAMGSLAIVKDGTVVYTRAIGFSQINGTGKKPLTAASRFRIGSITKTFTVAMIFQLVEEGKLKLTDTLDKFVPQIPNASKITIAHILAHRRFWTNTSAFTRTPTLPRNSRSPGRAGRFSFSLPGHPLFRSRRRHRINFKSKVRS